MIKRSYHNRGEGLIGRGDLLEGRLVLGRCSVVLEEAMTEKELKALDRIVTMYLDYAEDQAERGIPMTMQDWETRLNRFITATDREILQDAGKVTAEIARAHAESEFEKYRIVQDRLFESDFDKMINQLPPKGDHP